LIHFAHYVALAKADKVLFEVEDNYQKQTYRTRCYINSPNGRQLLNVPIKNANSTQKTKDVRIDNSFDWYKQHIKAIQISYRSSPYFEFYEDDLLSLFEKTPQFLQDFNFKCQETILELLQLEISSTITNEYLKEYTNIADFRFLADANNIILISIFRCFQINKGLLRI
jgi:hypothetical protein